MPDSPTPVADTTSWSAADALDLYHVPTWGEGFFGVNDAGHVTVRPLLGDDLEIDLADVLAEIVERDIALPVVVRFMDLLAARVTQINTVFREAMQEAGYGGGYSGVYPIKVNQLREVVDEIVEAGESYGFGLECGSKAELVATLPRLTDDETLLVCNGYKDEPMLRMMVTAQQLGKRVVPIMEKYHEFETLLAVTDALDAPPRFGVRVKLSTMAAGPWTASSGDRSKFGVPLSELLDLVDRLEARGETDALQLLHFHLGSQISDIQALKTAVREISRVYAHLHARGLAIPYLDVGGGLGVNYDALPTGAGHGGVDYSMQEYANAIVYAVMDVCDAEGVPHPTLISENGRALTAHHSVLAVEVVSSTSRLAVPPDFTPEVGSHEVVEELFALWRRLRLNGVDRASHHRADGPGLIPLGELLEAYHDLVELRDKTEALFGYGYLPLEQKAVADRLVGAVMRALHARVASADPAWVPEELQGLGEQLSDQLICAFSVFQSLMDHWAIGQRFPVMPVHRLDEAPTRRATIADLTCDSDGKIARFAAPSGEKTALEVHDLRPGQRYLLGIFLVGAYQDILGDAHNLMGSVTEVHVRADADEPGNYFLEEVIRGASVSEMLARVQYFPQDLHNRMEALLKEKTRSGALRPKVAKSILDTYRSLFDTSTYIESPTADAP